MEFGNVLRCLLIIALVVDELVSPVDSQTALEYSEPPSKGGLGRDPTEQPTTPYRGTTNATTASADEGDTTVVPPEGGKIPIHIGGFFSLPGGGWDGSGVLVATEMALDHINADPNILEDYELKMVWSDTMVSLTTYTLTHFWS